jgi:class 3 adenylate cyclase/tetratricopeptide (TPR) repeat protein
MSSEACSACGAANPAGALFCGRCGARLGLTCPSCQAVVARDAAFCTSCGAALQTRPEPAAEERKIVSVLFADLVGFTSRAERLDPEDVRGLLAPYHARLRVELERYSGTVEKFIGDAVVALFGAPVAHEDDPERAVRAALAVRDAIGELNAADPGLALQVRLGVTTGEALVTRDARTSEGEGMAAGDVVNTAARLQVAAPVDGILVDEATYRVTEHAIEYREHEPVSAKGKAELVPSWEVVAPRARLGVDIAFRGGAGLIGRDDELGVLRDALARVARERRAQLITLVGVPGIGKSRLVYELWAALSADSDLYAYWRQGRSLPYGEGISFWALGEMAKAHAGILESDGAEAAEAKLSKAVQHAVSDPAEASWVESHLRPLVGLGGETGTAERRGEAFAAWRRFFESLAEQRPLVLVFEDVHWADDGLLDFVDHLVDWVSDMPLLVVCTARPELLERRPDWGGGKRNAITISLAPLSDDDTVRLLAALAATAPSRLVSRAGGNPLYAEEYARMLAQREDGDDLPLPDSVQGIIAARLDTLPLEEKAVLQDAAVIGKVFWVGAVAAVGATDAPTVDERLHALERKEFVRRERRSSVAGETAYVFHHELVREVSYGQIPRPRRAAQHEAAAEWIDSLAGDRSDDLADLVAHHLVRALELTRAAGGASEPLAERARLALRAAGDRAASLNAFEAAAHFYGAALGLWPDDHDERAQLRFRYGRARFFSEDSGDEDLARAAEELLDAGDRESAAEAQSMIGELRWIEGRHDDAFQLLEGAAALLDGAPPSRSRAYVLGNLARFRMVADETREAIRLGVEAQRMGEALGLDDIRAHALTTVGLARAGAGDPAGLADLERGIDIAARLNSPEVIRGYNNLASLHAARGELERAFELYATGRDAAKRFGRPRALAWFDSELMYEHYWRGHWNDALALADQFVREVESGVPHLRVVDARLVRARIRFASGEHANAEKDSLAGLEFARRAPDPQTLFPALAFEARLMGDLGRVEEATTYANELLGAWAKTTGTFPSFWTADLAAALLAIDGGASIEDLARGARMQTLWLEAALALARREFLSAATAYARIGSGPDEAFARLCAGAALIGADRRAEGDVEIAAALDFFRAVGAAAYVRKAEALVATPA